MNLDNARSAIITPARWSNNHFPWTSDRPLVEWHQRAAAPCDVYQYFGYPNPLRAVHCEYLAKWLPFFDILQPISGISSSRSSTVHYTGNNGRGLLIPIDPSQQSELNYRYTWRPDAASHVKDGQLFATIAHQLYTLWRSTDSPITQDREQRVASFPDSLHVIRPSLEPGAILTPQK